jgi:hypothetical protein
MSDTPNSDDMPEVRIELSEGDAPHTKEVITNDPPAKKRFSIRKPPRGMKITVSWPRLLPGYEPFVFRLRLALSEDMQKKQEEWAALPADKLAAQQKGQILEEICDLLVDHPTGFDPEEYDYANPGDPGNVLRSFVAAVTGLGADPDAKFIVEGIVRAANNGYWDTVAPRSFSGEI